MASLICNRMILISLFLYLYIRSLMVAYRVKRVSLGICGISRHLEEVSFRWHSCNLGNIGVSLEFDHAVEEERLWGPEKYRRLDGGWITEEDWGR